MAKSPGHLGLGGNLIRRVGLPLAVVAAVGTTGCGGGSVEAKSTGGGDAPVTAGPLPNAPIPPKPQESSAPPAQAPPPAPAAEPFVCTSIVIRSADSGPGREALQYKGTTPAPLNAETYTGAIDYGTGTVILVHGGRLALSASGGPYQVFGINSVPPGMTGPDANGAYHGGPSLAGGSIMGGNCTAIA